MRRHARALSWQARASLVAVAMVGLVVLGAAATRGGDAPSGVLGATPPVTARVDYWPPVPSPRPVPSPSPAPTTATPQPSPPPGGAASTPPVEEKVRATPSTSPAALAPGARIGLEPVTHPGYRVRHRDFVGRIDPVGAGSSALDRADSTFTVRAGLADRSCVSLEAVNYPGYYLRHQDFAIHLHRREPSALYAADATFCPRAGLAGRDVSLRSYNYPTGTSTTSGPGCSSRRGVTARR
ncbi:hypothetical protein Psuf_080980 [Phytohabitans suffuscus]|uniref:Alpha-L-arabinofuranosidase B arabinose-binding domain-containing protein n=1 Tax=Phytohabitans suffuscus TaxID=624315 RepID=A0A6F8YX91_9ACTN|nr:AbfB domain-containing protein [Phytohabitans suffuscus]BCB90785.1 hypothetical protein Psuf_080980 [Phytohabitans suffuscus]